MLAPGEFIERGVGREFRGRALDEDSLVVRAVLPARVRADVFKPPIAQRLADLATGGFLALGLDDEVCVTRDVVGVGTNELGHDSIG